MSNTKNHVYIVIHICGFVYLSFPNLFEVDGISESSHEDHVTETSPIYNF